MKHLFQHLSHWHSHSLITAALASNMICCLLLHIGRSEYLAAVVLVVFKDGKDAIPGIIWLTFICRERKGLRRPILLIAHHQNMFFFRALLRTLSFSPSGCIKMRIFVSWPLSANCTISAIALVLSKRLTSSLHILHVWLDSNRCVIEGWWSR